MFRRVVPVAILVLSALGAAPLAQQPASTPPLEKGPTLSGFAPARRAAHLDLEKRFDARAQGREPARLDAPARRPPAPPRLAVRQGQRRVHRRPVPFLGLRGRHHRLPGAVPDADPAEGRARGPDEVRGVADRAGAEGRRHLEPGGRGAAAVQRLLARRRRDRRARLRQLRRAGRLRGARAPRHRREGQDRHRALRRIVARHQAEGRGRARRGRLPDLLGSARGRLLPGRRLPDRRLAQRPRRAARLGDGHADVSRRSADARRRRDQGRQAPAVQGSGDADEDPGAADLLRRRAAAAQGARRADGARRPGAARCRSPTTSVPARPAST